MLACSLACTNQNIPLWTESYTLTVNVRACPRGGWSQFSQNAVSCAIGNVLFCWLSELIWAARKGCGINSERGVWSTSSGHAPSQYWHSWHAPNLTFATIPWKIHATHCGKVTIFVWWRTCYNKLITLYRFQGQVVDYLVYQIEII